MAKLAKKTNSGANLGFEATLWAAADKLRNNMDAAEYKHVALGRTFLKYISDAFEERHQTLIDAKAEGADPEDPEEYQPRTSSDCRTRLVGPSSGKRSSRRSARRSTRR